MTKRVDPILKLETMTGLTTELMNLYSDVKNGTIDLKEAAELNNTAGKIINSVKVQLEYFALSKTQPKIKQITGK
jgi:hypothetical protein